MSKFSGSTKIYYLKKIIHFFTENLSNLFSKKYSKIHLITDGASWAVDTSSNDILNLAVLLLMFAAIFHLVDGLQASGLGLLRGIQDVQIPFILALLSYWIFGICSGYILGFIFKMGSIGTWLGMVIGLTVASISLILRFYLKVNSLYLEKNI